MKNSYFPMFVDISRFRILVAGGGKIAERRVKTLLKFQTDVTVIAPDVTEELQKLADAGKLILHRKMYEEKDLEQMDLVFAATDKKEVNQTIVQDCVRRGEAEQRRILVNTADDKDACDFYFPAVVQEEELVVGINSGGADPGRTRRVRGRIEQLFREETL